MDHEYETHAECYNTYCPICEGGLSCCVKCGGLEGALPSECPGERMTEEEIDAVYQGKKDFVDGRWVESAISIHSPAYYRQLQK